MSENLPNIDDLFKKAIDQHEESPSANVWEAIDKNLDKKKVAFLSARYNKLRWVAAALLLFSFGMAMYVWQTKMKNKELVNQTKINKASKINRSNTKKDDDVNVVKPEINTQEDKRSADNINPNNNHTNPLDTQATISIKKDEEQQTNSNQRKFSKEKNNVLAVDQRKFSTSNSDIKSNGDTRNNTFQSVEKNNKAVYAKKEKEENTTTIPIEKNQNITVEKQNTDRESKKGISTEKYIAGVPLITTSPFNEQFEIKSLYPFKYTPPAFSLDNTVAVANKNPSSKKNSSKSAKNSSLSATIFFSPEFVASDVKDDHPRFREDNRNEIKNSETVKSSSSYGVLVDKMLGNKWKVGSGVYVISRVTDIKPKKIFARPDERGNVNFRLNCSAGAAYIPLKSGANPTQGDSTTILSATNTLQYLSIPLSVKYVIGKGKLNVTPGIGIAVNFLSKGKVESVIATASGNESNSSNNIEGLKSNYLNSQISLGLEYKLSKRIALNFTPTARLALTSINKSAPVKTKLNSLGLAAGITIKL